MGELNYGWDYPASGFMPTNSVEVICSDKFRILQGQLNYVYWSDTFKLV